ncbi:hypothetical protein FRB98_001725 [Tulasnella sp. 332]|nr:hypothetical protein FRB98_001725 [Tulasnella sp. 332]
MPPPYIPQLDDEETDVHVNDLIEILHQKKSDGTLYLALSALLWLPHASASDTAGFTPADRRPHVRSSVPGFFRRSKAPTRLHQTPQSTFQFQLARLRTLVEPCGAQGDWLNKPSLHSRLSLDYRARSLTFFQITPWPHIELFDSTAKPQVQPRGATFPEAPLKNATAGHQQHSLPVKFDRDSTVYTQSPAALDPRSNPDWPVESPANFSVASAPQTTVTSPPSQTPGQPPQPKAVSAPLITTQTTTTTIYSTGRNPYRDGPPSFHFPNSPAPDRQPSTSREYRPWLPRHSQLGSSHSTEHPSGLHISWRNPLRTGLPGIRTEMATSQATGFNEREERERQDELQPTTSPPGGRSGSGSSGTGIVSGGVSMGSSCVSPPGFVSQQTRRPVQGSFIRSPAGPTSTSPFSSQSPQMMRHPSQHIQQSQQQQQLPPPSSYYPPHSASEYTRTTPSPVYYAMQYPPHQMQLSHHNSPYGGPGGPSYSVSSTQMPPNMPHMVASPPGYSGFSQAYGHPSIMSLSPDVGSHMGYGSMYGQPYLSSPIHEHGPGVPSSYLTPTGSAGGGGPSGNTAASTVNEPTTAPAAKSSVSSSNISGPANTTQLILSPSKCGFSFSHRSYATYDSLSSILDCKPYTQQFTPPTTATMPIGGPVDGHDRGTVPSFPSHQPGGTWLYLPPGGGPPQQYQGAPFGLGYGTPPHQELAGQSTPSGELPTATPEAEPSTSPSAYRGTGGSWRRGGAAPRRGGRGSYRGPRGGGPTGAGLAAGSPSGGSRPPPNASESPSGSSRPPRKSTLMGALTAPAYMRRGASPVRQAFHPKPPTHGNEWVMWVGNVPENTTDAELWQFFQNPQIVNSMQAMMDSYARGVEPDPTAWQHELDTASSQQPEDPSSSSEPPKNGVTSIFLIKTSYCAFVNFDSEESLKRAVRTFNGVPLHPYDPECPRLVCRRRRKDDDLRSGVAAQRGWGLHTNWIRMQAAAMKKSGFVPEAAEGRRSKATVQSDGADGRSGVGDDEDVSHGVRRMSLVDGDAEVDPESPKIMLPPHLRAHDDPPTSPSTHLGHSSNSDPSPPSKVDLKRPPFPPYHDSSNSSHDLQTSVERGLWATQPHNEPVLDQAFRTSKEVYLVFGANRTGEFYGYAKMAGPISQGERKVSWAPRTDSSGSSRSNGSPSVSRHRSSYPIIVEEPPIGDDHQPPSSLPTETDRHQTTGEGDSPHILDAPIAASPAAFVPEEEDNIPSPAVHAANQHQSAPAELGPYRKRVTYPAKRAAGDTLGMPTPGRPIMPVLDPSAPFRAIKNPPSVPEEDRQAVIVDDKPVTEAELARRAETEGSSFPKEAVPGADGQKTEDRLPGTWGTAFKVQWIKTERLPFIRVRHLRNRWNYDREVKVSRDGTELEPTTGDSLLREWDRLEEERRRLLTVPLEQSTRPGAVRLPAHAHATTSDTYTSQDRRAAHLRSPVTNEPQTLP